MNALSKTDSIMAYFQKSLIRPLFLLTKNWIKLYVAKTICNCVFEAQSFVEYDGAHEILTAIPHVDLSKISKMRNADWQKFASVTE